MALSKQLILLACSLFVITVCYGQNHDIQWEARVVTTDKWYAGTDADVYIQIIGPQGKTRNIELDNDDNNFERKDIDVFYFRATDVGIPTHVRVWHDDSGSHSGWHLTRIELTRVEKEFTKTYIFNCECWLAWDESDRKVDRTLPVATMNWRAWVHTSNINSAGSDSHVSIVIYGDKGHSRHIPLHYESDDFEQGETDTFMLSTVEVGIPNKIRVITDDDDDWHLDKIELENMNGAAKYTFDCDCWLAKDGQKTREIWVQKPKLLQLLTTTSTPSHGSSSLSN